MKTKAKATEFLRRSKKTPQGERLVPCPCKVCPCDAMVPPGTMCLDCGMDRHVAEDGELAPGDI